MKAIRSGCGVWVECAENSIVEGQDDQSGSSLLVSVDGNLGQRTHFDGMGGSGRFGGGPGQGGKLEAGIVVEGGWRDQILDKSDYVGARKS